MDGDSVDDVANVAAEDGDDSVAGADVTGVVATSDVADDDAVVVVVVAACGDIDDAVADDVQR